MSWIVPFLLAGLLAFIVWRSRRGMDPVQVGGTVLSPELFVKGQYEAVPGRRPIGNGAFGTVEISRPRLSLLNAALTYLFHVTGERNENGHVAIKYMRYSEEPAKNEEMDRALAKEITLLKSSSDHPNILRVLGLWLDPKTTRLGIVSEFADQGALSTYLMKKPSFLVRTTILRDVATGLEYLHKYPTKENQVGIAHGDLHPANVLIMTDGAGVKAVLGDFGLCKVVDEHGMTSSSLRANGVAGLAAYLGPELYRSEDLGAAVAPQEKQSEKYDGLRTVKGDVFAFGMLSFTTLGGDLSLALCGGNAALPPIPIAMSIVEGRRPSWEHMLLGKDADPYRDAVRTYWDVITACWQHNAVRRPAIENVRDKIPGTKVPQ